MTTAMKQTFLCTELLLIFLKELFVIAQSGELFFDVRDIIWGCAGSYTLKQF